MQKILITGAAGDVGTRLRKLLKGVYPSIRTSDIRMPADLGKDEDFISADLADLVQVKKIVAGVEGIVHLGGFSVEGPFSSSATATPQPRPRLLGFSHFPTATMFSGVAVVKLQEALISSGLLRCCGCAPPSRGR